MCGIIGYIGPKEVVPLLIDGLKRLEYRGYDSAGIAILSHSVEGNGNGLFIHKKKGKIRDLELSLDALPLTPHASITQFSSLSPHSPHSPNSLPLTPDGHDSSSVLSHRKELVVSRKVLLSPFSAMNFPDVSRLTPNDLINIGIGHTRWATHGKPSDRNAHPHSDCSGKIAVVHNGIIENYAALKKQLISEGHQFTSETDTEVIAHLIERELNGDLTRSVIQALKWIEGSYAIGVVSLEDPERLIVARKGSPLVLGCGEGENFLASDVPAILPHTKKVIYLNDNEIAEIYSNGIKLFSLNGLHSSPLSSNSPDALQKRVYHIDWDASMAEKCGYKHFMLKEIHEQPRAIRDTFGRYVLKGKDEVNFDEVKIGLGELKDVQKIYIIACGTSYHAALIGKLMLERHVNVSVEVDVASEFRYRSPLFPDRCLTIAISQSGETADTIAAIRQAKESGSKILSICNVVGSSVTRESDDVIYTHAGPEIGVASTKAFATQVVALYLFTIHMGVLKGTLSSSMAKEMVEELYSIPDKLESILAKYGEIEDMATLFHKKSDFLYLGRSFAFPIAMEGALKLKEISYIHAEGYPAGEMKHGPIALVNEEMPVVALAPKSSTYDKILSNIEEVKARGGTVIAIATQGDERIKEKADHVFYIPEAPEELATLLMTVPLQLLAYYIADCRRCEIDQPRNLAKSVTVE